MNTYLSLSLVPQRKYLLSLTVALYSFLTLISKQALIFLSCFLFANGQIKKKSILVGGQVFYYNSNINYSGNQSNQKNKQAALNLSIGRAFQENSIFGLNLTYSPSSVNNFYNGAGFINNHVKQYSFGVFNRRYKKLANDFYFFAEFGAAFIAIKQVNEDTLGVKLETLKQSGGQLTLMPGISYKILNKLHLEILIPNLITIQYAITKDNIQSESAKQKQFLLNSSLNSNGLSFLGVGFHFIL